MPILPFLSLKPRQYFVNLWAVVIEETGYQIPHLHSSGWLSGYFIYKFHRLFALMMLATHGWD